MNSVSTSMNAVNARGIFIAGASAVRGAGETPAATPRSRSGADSGTKNTSVTAIAPGTIVSANSVR